MSFVQINRPQKKNSLNAELRHEIEAVPRQITGDPQREVLKTHKTLHGSRRITSSRRRRVRPLISTTLLIGNGGRR